MEKFDKSINDLEQALLRKKEALNEHVIYAGISKCFEVCLEYSWKRLKSKIEDEGLEAYAPKEILRVAGQIGIVDNVEDWIKYINVRNFAVHDYLSVTKEEYIKTIENFIVEVKKLQKNLQKNGS